MLEVSSGGKRKVRSTSSPDSAKYWIFAGWHLRSISTRRLTERIVGILSQMSNKKPMVRLDPHRDYRRCMSPDLKAFCC